MQRNEIMQRIIDLETEMFMSVNAEEAVPANTIPAFKEMRRMTFLFYRIKQLLCGCAIWKQRKKTDVML